MPHPLGAPAAQELVPSRDGPAPDPAPPPAPGTMSGPAPDNPRGLAVMLAGFFVFAAVDTIAKFLTAELHPLQIVWTRQLGLVAIALVLILRQGRGVLASRRPGLQVVRGVLAASSAALFIFGVRHVPLADAVAVSFVAPFVVTVLGALVLREPVGVHRWAAIAIGFVATLIVIRPGFGTFHPAMLLVVVASVLFASRQVLSRVITARDSTATTVVYTAFVGSAVLTLAQPFIWTTPGSVRTLALMAAIAALAGLGEYLIVRALEIAQAVVVAPAQYSLILWSSIYGYLVFGQFPDGWTWFGTAIIVATGLYTMQRERRRKRRPGTVDVAPLSDI